MKNNRGAVSEAQTAVFVSQLGDPSRLSFLEKLKDQGEYEIELLDLSYATGKKAYRALKNNPDKFTVVLEDDHVTRNTVFMVVRYIRKTQCLLEDLVPELKVRSASPSPTKSESSPPKVERKTKKAKSASKKRSKARA